jgi:hypothetical protein
MCWEKSFIPLDIWKAGDANTNIVESVHSDINREGVRCTLLGGIMKAEIYDWNKMEALKVCFLALFQLLTISIILATERGDIRNSPVI